MTVTMTMTVTKKQGTMPLLKVDCPRKASRPLESESWSAQAKLQGRRKQSKYCWPKNKQEICKYILFCLLSCLIGQLEKRSSPLIRV